MGLLKKKEKKKKIKKPITIDRVIKWLTPLFLIVLIIVAGYNTFQSCGININDYKKLENELSREFDYNSMLTTNKIIYADTQTLKEKIGPNGADIPIIINGNISGNVFNKELAFAITSGFGLSDCEVGAFVNAVNNTSDSTISVNILELTINKVEDSYDIICVYEIDLSSVDLELDIDMTKMGSFYIRSQSNVMQNNKEYVVNSCTSQLNALTEENNKMVTQLINTMFGYQYDIGVEMTLRTIQDLAKKIDARVVIEDNFVDFVID